MIFRLVAICWKTPYTSDWDNEGDPRAGATGLDSKRRGLSILYHRNCYTRN